MFKYEGSNRKIQEAVGYIDENLLSKLAFLIEQSRFQMSSASSKWLSVNFIKFLKSKNFIDNIYIHTYYNPFGFAIAKFKPSTPDVIYLNTAKLNRSPGSIVGTLIHEASHMFDHETFEHDFGHGDNSSVGKENTFPYKAGNLAMSIVDGVVPRRGNLENRKISTVKSIYTKVLNLIRRLF